MQSNQSLCPGYRQVDSFGAEDEYESDEQVFYVTLDLGAAVEPTLVASSSNYRLIVSLDIPYFLLGVTYYRDLIHRLLSCNSQGPFSKANTIDSLGLNYFSQNQRVSHRASQHLYHKLIQLRSCRLFA